MWKDRCSHVFGFTAARLIKRAPFIFGFLMSTMFVFSSINGDPEVEEYGSYILLKNRSSSAECKKPKLRKPVCAGILLTKRYVLTAGSCLDYEEIEMHAGLLRNYTRQVLRPKEGFVHSGYTTQPNLIRNDIALMHPVRPIRVSKYVFRAKLAESKRKFTKGTECHVVIITEDSKGVHTKKKNITIVEPSKCNIGGPTELCMDQADVQLLPGTPLYCRLKKKKITYAVAGILSRRKSNYTIYTNIPHYRDWIKTIRH